jgi:hypothetical protein
LDNQQERSILSPDFLAGLIVGEGSYSLYVARQTKLWEFKPMFQLRMNDLETMDLVRESFAYHNLALYQVPGLYKKCRAVRVDGIKRMRAHLDFFLPLLTGKKLEAATIVSDFIDRRLSLPPKTKYTDDDVDFFVKIREVNGPNVNRIPIEILRDYTRRPDGRRRVTGKI